jgi:hypothetical protein
MRIQLPADFPLVITLCGSTKFKTYYEQINRQLTNLGLVVFSCGFFGHADEVTHTPEQKVTADRVHFRKIDLSHAIVVINVGGYIGHSTRNEINYARQTEKDIYYLEIHDDSPPNAGTLQSLLARHGYRQPVVSGA